MRREGSSSSRRASWGLVGWLCASACGGSTPVGDDGGSGSTSEGTGPGVTGDSTVGPGMTGPASTGTGTATAGTLDDSTTGDSTVCDPPRGIACEPPGPATIGWQLRVDGAESSGDVLGACTVVEVLDDGVTATVSLDCTSFVAEIDLITMNPHHVPALAPDDPVELRATSFNEDEAVVARYLTLRRGGLALGAFDASRFLPPPEFDYGPVTLEVVPTECPEQATECVYEQDAALQVEFDGQSATLFQGHDASVGQLTSYRVLTGRVERELCTPDNGCGFSYAEWFVQGLVFFQPDG